MRVAVYARVSTTHQSAEPQLRDLREYAERRGFGIVREYVDEGVSGARDKRPALNDLMRDARRRDFDIVLVWKFDRFARSLRHLVEALHTFRSLGIQFISYQEQIDTGSPMGEAMFSIIGAMAQLERDLISERVKMGLRNARAKGKRLGRPVSGYAEEDLGKIPPLRRQGRSIREISRILGIPRSTVGRYLQNYRA